MHLFARNRRKRSKRRVLNTGPTQIDPRGHDATRNSDICSYCVGHWSKIKVFLVERHLGHIQDAGGLGDPHCECDPKRDDSAMLCSGNGGVWPKSREFWTFQFGTEQSAKKCSENARKKTRIRLDRRVAILISFFDAYGRFGRFCTRPALALRCFGVVREP